MPRKPTNPQKLERNKWERHANHEQRIKATNIPPEEINTVYQHWLQTMRPNRRGPKPQLDHKRTTKIAAAIADYGTENCMKAIDGCSQSPFHMGQNKMHRRYDEIELIFRDQTHIENFLTINETHGPLTW